jgi:hypothetical protein
MLASADANAGSGPTPTRPNPTHSRPPAATLTNTFSTEREAGQSAGGAAPVATDPEHRCPPAGAAALASVGGSHVGWFLNRAAQPPAALWGHVQFARGSGAASQPGGSSSDGGEVRAGGGDGLAAGAHVPAAGSARLAGSGSAPSTNFPSDTSYDASRGESRLLYLNWQPHYEEVCLLKLSTATSHHALLRTHASAMHCLL